MNHPKSQGSRKSFDASTALDEPDESELEDLERRLQIYSVEALRTGSVVDKIFVRHPDFERAITALDRLFQLGLEFDVPQGVRLIGQPGTGKSAAFSYFKKSLPGSSLYSSGAGAIGARLQRTPVTGRVIATLFQAIDYPFASGSAKRMFDRRGILYEAIRSKGTRLIWIDEAHHLMLERHVRDNVPHETETAEFLREMMDETRTSLVLAGSSDLHKLDVLVPALASRVAGIEQMREIPDGANWAGFIRAFADACSSYDVGFIKTPEIMRRLYMATKGNMRSFKRLLVEAVLIAVDAPSLQLNKDILSKAYKETAGSAAPRENPFA